MHFSTKTIFSYAIAFTLLISGIGSFGPTINTIAQSVDSDFNQNYLLSDESFSTNVIFPNEKSIQDYLERVNSPLKNYSTEGARASHWIFTAARGITSSAYNVKPNINPALLLTFLEKEQSLLTYTNYDINTDPENRIKTAMGYGCPDNFSCADKFRGFVNQLNYGAYQLQFNYNLSTKNTSEKFRVGNTIKTTDNQDVTLTNAATAAVYRYTPHVYYSGYNLWKIMTTNKWGSTGQIYQGSFFDNTSPNVNLPDSFKVTFEDDVIYKPTQTKVNVSIVVTDPQSDIQKQNNCNEFFRRNWTFGEENSDVEKLQQCLRDKNVFDHVITGYFGPITRAGLGIVRGQLKTTSNVIVITSPTNSNPVVQDNCNVLKQQNWVYGTSSDEVEKLQKCMQKIGVFNHIYGATGYFGPVTQKALNTWRGMA